MEKEVAVEDLVEAARLEEQAHVTLQFLAADEGLLEAPHDFFLFRRERVGIGKVDGRKHRIGELVLHAVDHHGAAFEVDLV